MRENLDRRIPAAAWAIAVLFLAEASALALFVTPLWDVPDEVVHFATIGDIVEGRGIPRAGAGVVPPPLVRAWNPRFANVTVFNWAAIHPPGYHVLAAPFLAAARAAGADLEGQVRATRLFSAICGAAALLLFYRVLREAGADPPIALAAMAAAAAVPTYLSLSAGVNHDVLCAVFGGAAAIAWMRFLRSGAARDALPVALWLAAAGAVKATAVPAAIALLLLIGVRLRGGIAARLTVTAALAAVALSTTVIWALRRGTVPGADLTPEGAAGSIAAPASAAGALVDQSFKNFFGLIGWTGTGRGDVAWVQVSGGFLAVYLALATALAGGTALWIRRRDAETSSLARRAGWAAAAIVLVAAAVAGAAGGRPADAVKVAAEAAPFAVAAAALPRAWSRRSSSDDAVSTSQIVVLCFAAAYVAHTGKNLLHSGAVRGTHGRYFYVVLPFLLTAFVLPAADTLRRGAARARVLAAAVLVLLADEALFFALRVLPFYRGGR